MLSNKMKDSFKVYGSISNIPFLLSPETVISDLNNSLIQILIVSSRGALVKSESTSNYTINYFEFWLIKSLANLNESLIVYSFIIKHLSKGTKNLAQPEVSVLIAESIGCSFDTTGLSKIHKPVINNFPKFHHEVNKLQKILSKNANPERFIDKCIQKFLNNLFI